MIGRLRFYEVVLCVAVQFLTPTVVNICMETIVRKEQRTVIIIITVCCSLCAIIVECINPPVS